MERNYQFRERMLQVHKRDLRDDNLWKKRTGTIIEEGWEIVYPADADRVLLHAAHDLREFFEISMGMYLLAHPAASIADAAAAPARRIVLTDAAHTPDLAPAYTEKGAYRLYAGESFSLAQAFAVLEMPETLMLSRPGSPIPDALAAKLPVPPVIMSVAPARDVFCIM